MAKVIKLRKGDTAEIRKNGEVICDVQIAQSCTTQSVNLSFKAPDDIRIVHMIHESNIQ